MTRADHVAKNGGLHGILSWVGSSWSGPPRWRPLAEAQSRRAVVIGESSRGGSVAVAATDLLRYEEARR